MSRADVVLHSMRLEDEAAAMRLPATTKERQAWWTRCATSAFLQARAYADVGDTARAMQWAAYGHACERRAEAAV